MRAKSILSLCASLAMLFPTIASAAEASQGAGGLSGTVAPKVTLFDYTGGGDAGRAHYLQRYDYQKSWFGDNISGAYMDLDLDLGYSNGKGTSLSLERRGDGLTNQAGKVRFDTSKIGVAGYYNHHRTVSVGLDYLTRPNNVRGGTDPAYTAANSSFVSQFNDDSDGSFFRIDRTIYGAGVKLKPALLGDMASLSVNHDGYRRVGNTYATWVAGSGDFTGGANPRLNRWRGYDKPVNENMDRGSIGFAASPMGWFQFAYDGSFEKFVSRAQNYTIGDFASRPSVIAAGSTVLAASRPNALHFIPDSTLTSHSVKVSRTFAKAALAAGYGMSVLGIDSFTGQQDSASYSEGKIASQNFFVNGKVRVVPAVEAEAYLKYGNRRNDSTFPAAVTLLTPTLSEKLDMRLNTLKTVEYGVAATLRPTGSKSSLAAGWKRLTKKRGFTLSNVGIRPQRLLYEADSNTNEVYLKGSARPMDGMTVRLTPSYEWSDKVGSPIDAKQAFNLKAAGSYATTEGGLLSVYYGFKDKRNGALDYTNGTTAVQTSSVGQNLRSVLHSAGASLSAALTPKVNSSVSLDWAQNDFQSDYITSNIRRYEAGAITFTTRERSTSKIDTYSLALATDFQASEPLKLSGGYMFNRSKGKVATGLVATELDSTVDGTINNDLHTVSLGADYAITKALNLVGQYVFDHYKDKQYASLSGSGHTLSTALAYRF